MTDTDISQPIDEWIQSLYDPKTNELIIDYAGKTLVFNKRFAAKIAFSLRDKSEQEQAYALISMLSKSPHFTPDQAAKLPMDLITKFMLGLDIDPDLVKKTNPRAK